MSKSNLEDGVADAIAATALIFLHDLVFGTT